RVLKTGHMLAYEPAAVVRHRHRRDTAAVRSQLRSWLVGVHAAFASLSRTFPDERRALAAFRARLLLAHYPRRVLTAAFGTRLRLDLVGYEIRGALESGGRYAQALAEAQRIANRFTQEPSFPPPTSRRRAGAAPVAGAEAPALHELQGPGTSASGAQRVHRVAVDVARALPDVLACNGAAHVVVHLERSGQPLGTVTL